MEKTTDEKLIEQAHKAFETDFAYESDSRNLFKEDLRFANGDPDNKFQWEQSFVSTRELTGRPCLTINKVKTHNRQITNEARQNKPSVKVNPVDSGADRKTADIFNGIIRHIEVNSDAETAYDIAGDFAVDAGIGYWRITTDFASEDSFDQEIFIDSIKNPLNVLLDSRIQKPDGSDAKRAFIFRDMPKDEFEDEYPDAEPLSWDVLGNGWLQKDSVRVAEYFYIEPTKDKLYAFPDGTTKFKSDLEPDDVKYLDAKVKTKEIRAREVKSTQVKWCLIAGDQILDRKDWAGKYIPIVRVVGEEKEIDGKLDRKGHTRQMKDAQRMYNYNSSASIEHGALQTKTPIISAAEAIEGYEKYWNAANTENLPYLPYNHVDADGNPLPMPQRMPSPAPAQLYFQGMEVAANEMNMASGQFEAQFGNNPQAQSGKALNALQRKGDIATFHFIDNVARAIKYTGKILVDLIPKIYDTARIIRIIGEDGTEQHVTIDPNQPQSYSKQRDETGAIKEIFNPSVGRYDVTVSVGASYSTRRQEAFDAMIQMTQGNPQLMQVAGDIIMKAADFPMADELSKRLEKTLPPNLQDHGDEESPEVQQVKSQAQQMQQQLQQQLDAAHQAMAEAEQEAKVLEQKANSTDVKNALEAKRVEIEEYRAQTERIKVELDAANQVIPDKIAMIEQAVSHLIETIEPPEIEQNETNEPPQGGFFTPEDTVNA